MCFCIIFVVEYQVHQSTDNKHISKAARSPKASPKQVLGYGSIVNDKEIQPLNVVEPLTEQAYIIGENHFHFRDISK